MSLIIFVHLFRSFDMLLCVFCVYVLYVVLPVGETDLLTSYANKNLESWILFQHDERQFLFVLDKQLSQAPLINGLSSGSLQLRLISVTISRAIGRRARVLCGITRVGLESLKIDTIRVALKN